MLLLVEFVAFVVFAEVLLEMMMKFVFQQLWFADYCHALLNLVVVVRR